VNIARPAQRKVDHPSAHGLKAELVDQDETAQHTVDGIGLEYHRRAGREIHRGDLVQAQRLGGQMCPGVHVLAKLDLGDGGRDLFSWAAAGTGPAASSRVASNATYRPRQALATAKGVNVEYGTAKCIGGTNERKWGGTKKALWWSDTKRMQTGEKKHALGNQFATTKIT
jgi:hypothetical protein